MSTGLGEVEAMPLCPDGDCPFSSHVHDERRDVWNDFAEWWRRHIVNPTCSRHVVLAAPLPPPTPQCETKIYHPNIDLEGNICLNILREDWNPVLNLQAIAFGLVLIFQVRFLPRFLLHASYSPRCSRAHDDSLRVCLQDPGVEDPLNKEAAEVFRKDIKRFERVSLRCLSLNSCCVLSFS